MARKAKRGKTRDTKQAPKAPQGKIKLDPMSVFRAEAAASNRRAEELFKTNDGFDNFISRIGLRNNNTISASGYEFDLITRNRLKLEAAYRGSWVVGAIVDSIAEDMTRAGLDIQAAKDDGDIRKIRAGISRLQLWQSTSDGIKWGRLYGGAIGVIQIQGQDLSTPLDIETIAKDQFQGVVIFDRWMVNPLLGDPIDSGPDMGLPTYYQIVNAPDEMSSNTSSSSAAQEAFSGQRVHYTRCIRFGGIKLPYFQAITEQMWDESVLERVWDRLISFDNTTMSAASLVDRANLRTVHIEGLREVLGAGAEATQGLYAQFDMMREMQTNEGLTLLDKNDDFSSTAYSFAGLSDILLQFGQQLAGACEIPLVRFFGQSPAGLSATGESDLRMYYDNINARQEAKLRNPWETLLKVLWRSELGKNAPDDMTFTFKPLWQMSATDKANNAKTTTESILGPYDSGIISRKTALIELKDASADTGLFNNITDEDIEEADADEPPAPDVEPGGAPGAEETNAPEGEKGKAAVPALDSRFIDNWEEGKHPRRDDGKFGQGGGGKKSSSESEGGNKPSDEQKRAIRFYSGSLSSQFIKADRGEKVDPDVAAQNEALNSYLKSAPKFEGDIHRGIVVEKSELKGLLEKYEAGAEVEVDAKQSWTKNDKAVESRLTSIAKEKEDPVKVYFDYPGSAAGVDVSSESRFPEEEEVIVPKGGKYKVDKIVKADGGYRIVMKNASGSDEGLQERFEKKYPYVSGTAVHSEGHTREEAVKKAKALRAQGKYATIWHMEGPKSGNKSRYALSEDGGVEPTEAKDAKWRFWR